MDIFNDLAKTEKALREVGITFILTDNELRIADKDQGSVMSIFSDLLREELGNDPGPIRTAFTITTSYKSAPIRYDKV